MTLRLVRGGDQATALRRGRRCLRYRAWTSGTPLEVPTPCDATRHGGDLVEPAKSKNEADRRSLADRVARRYGVVAAGVRTDPDRGGGLPARGRATAARSGAAADLRRGRAARPCQGRRRERRGRGGAATRRDRPRRGDARQRALRRQR